MLRISTLLAVLIAVGFPFRGYTQTAMSQNMSVNPHLFGKVLVP